MLTEALLEEVRVVAEDFVILDVWKGLSVVGVGLVEEHVEANSSEGEISYSDLVASDILSTV